MSPRVRSHLISLYDCVIKTVSHSRSREDIACIECKNSQQIYQARITCVCVCVCVCVRAYLFAQKFICGCKHTIKNFDGYRFILFGCIFTYIYIWCFGIYLHIHVLAYTRIAILSDQRRPSPLDQRRPSSLE